MSLLCTQELYGRSVTILRYKGQVHALDSKCYHMGGPLGEEGDIEDLGNGQTCISCPWHNYKAGLSSKL
jgi:nitrite reductase/ring-hydroxylating ferredoxin subunit